MICFGVKKKQKKLYIYIGFWIWIYFWIFWILKTDWPIFKGLGKSIVKLLKLGHHQVQMEPADFSSHFL